MKYSLVVSGIDEDYPSDIIFTVVFEKPLKGDFLRLTGRDYSYLTEAQYALPSTLREVKIISENYRPVVLLKYHIGSTELSKEDRERIKKNCDTFLQHFAQLLQIFE